MNDHFCQNENIDCIIGNEIFPRKTVIDPATCSKDANYLLGHPLWLGLPISLTDLIIDGPRASVKTLMERYSRRMQ